MKIPYLDEEVAPGVVIRRYEFRAGAFVKPLTEAERLIVEATRKIGDPLSPQSGAESSA